MEVRELRCGNIVAIRKTNVEYAITSLDIVTCSTKPDMFSPIPLTEEWLEKLGFDYDLITYAIGNIWLAVGTNSWSVFLHGLGNGMTCSVKYVHQLQNLYFALTGTELTLNESKCT